VFIRSGRFMAH